MSSGTTQDPVRPKPSPARPFKPIVPQPGRRTLPDPLRNPRPSTIPHPFDPNRRNPFERHPKKPSRSNPCPIGKPRGIPKPNRSPKIIRPGLYPGANPNQLPKQIPSPGRSPRPAFGSALFAELAILAATDFQERLAVKVATDMDLTDDNTETDEESPCITNNQPP